MMEDRTAKISIESIAIVASLLIAAMLLSFGEKLSDSVWAALLGAVVGALTSGLVIALHNKNSDKKRTSLRLIEEYASPSFLLVRNEGGAALRKALQEQPKTWDDLFHELENEEWQKISKIEHFYRKLDYMIKIKEVDEHYIKGFFEKEFPHWYDRYFRKILSASGDSESYKQLREMFRLR